MASAVADWTMFRVMNMGMTRLAIYQTIIYFFMRSIAIEQPQLCSHHVAMARNTSFRRKLAERAALHTILTMIKERPACYVCTLDGREGMSLVCNLLDQMPRTADKVSYETESLE